MAKKHEQEVVSTNGRFYYKSKDGKGFLNLKSPLGAEEAKDYIQITKEEFDELTYIEPTPVYEPTEAELAIKEKRSEIAALKQGLNDTDYVVIKIAEAETAEEQTALRQEYADVIRQRKNWRVQINALEAEVAELEAGGK